MIALFGCSAAWQHNACEADNDPLPADERPPFVAAWRQQAVLKVAHSIVQHSGCKRIPIGRV